MVTHDPFSFGAPLMKILPYIIVSSIAWFVCGVGVTILWGLTLKADTLAACPETTIQGKTNAWIYDFSDGSKTTDIVDYVEPDGSVSLAKVPHKDGMYTYVCFTPPDDQTRVVCSVRLRGKDGSFIAGEATRPNDTMNFGG